VQAEPRQPSPRGPHLAFAPPPAGPIGSGELLLWASVAAQSRSGPVAAPTRKTEGHATRRAARPICRATRP